MTASTGIAEDMTARLLDCANGMSRLPNFLRGGLQIAHRWIGEVTEGRCRVSVAGRLNSFGCSQAQLGGIKLQFLAYDCDDECVTSTERARDHHIVLHFPLRGSFHAQHGEHAVEARPGELLAVSTEGTISRRWRGPSQVLNLIIPRHLFSESLAADHDISFHDHFSFAPMAVVDLREAPTLVGLIDTIVTDLRRPSSSFRGPAGRHAERTLLALLLNSVPHPYASTIEKGATPAVPFYIRRAEVFMRANIAHTIDIDVIQAAAGVSVRTLYYGFKAHRGSSPMLFLKNLRLDEARAQLLAHPRERGVAAIAFRLGYPDPARFSRDYKTRFGETPGATLRRRPGRISLAQ